MPKRFCTCQGCPACRPTGCGELYDRDSTGTLRCPACQAVATQRRQARPSSSSRGLGWAHTQRKKNDAAYQAATRCQCPGCPRCGDGCRELFTQPNPKTAGHTIPRSQGGHTSPLLAVCRACNSSDGGRLAHGR